MIEIENFGRVLGLRREPSLRSGCQAHVRTDLTDKGKREQAEKLHKTN